MNHPRIINSDMRESLAFEVLFLPKTLNKGSSFSLSSIIIAVVLLLSFLSLLGID